MLEACILNGAPNHSLGRSMKVTKEDMVGLVKAVELYLALDHQAVARGWEEDVAQIIAALQDIPGVCAVRDEALYSEGIPVARITVDPQVAGRSAAEVAAALADGDPAVRATRIRDWLSLNPQFLEAGEVCQVTERLAQVLRA
jgi:D-glucosaminate-6-phosphate ammonia-lyase